MNEREIKKPKFIIEKEIKWIELYELWIKTKNLITYNSSDKFYKRIVKFLINRLDYHLNYSKYAPLANYGAKIISEYQIPYKNPSLINEEHESK